MRNEVVPNGTPKSPLIMIPDLIEFIYANLELSRLFKVSVKPLQSVWMSEAVWNRVGARGTLFDFLVRLITALDQTIP